MARVPHEFLPGAANASGICLECGGTPPDAIHLTPRVIADVSDARGTQEFAEGEHKEALVEMRCPDSVNCGGAQLVWLPSGLVRCETCGVAWSAANAQEAHVAWVKTHEPAVHVFSSGAKRSEKMTDFSQLPRPGLVRIAKRFELGEKHYGRDNWKKALLTREGAREFLRDAYNHAFNHLLLNAAPSDDDDLAAVGWFVVVAAYAEEVHGCPWREL